MRACFQISSQRKPAPDSSGAHIHLFGRAGGGQHGVDEPHAHEVRDAPDAMVNELAIRGEWF